jgi:hypothetical protein
MPRTGARLALWYPALTDNADVPEDMSLLANDLEGLGIFLYDQGTLAARPISSPASPGVEGRFYFANDTQKFFYDNGLGWIDLGGNHAGNHDPVTGTDRFSANLAGTLAERPDAADVVANTHFYATDQRAEYIESNDNWIRVTIPAGFGGFWFNNVAPPGFVIYNGSLLPSTDGIYADLYAHLGGVSLPDTRGRVLVGVGTNPDVGFIGANDNMGVVYDRRVKHKHSMNRNFLALYEWGGLGSGSSGWEVEALRIGPQTNAPTDGPAWITCAWIAKL